MKNKIDYKQIRDLQNSNFISKDLNFEEYLKNDEDAYVTGKVKVLNSIRSKDFEYNPYISNKNSKMQIGSNLSGSFFSFSNNKNKEGDLNITLESKYNNYANFKFYKKAFFYDNESEFPEEYEKELNYNIILSKNNFPIEDNALIFSGENSNLKVKTDNNLLEFSENGADVKSGFYTQSNSFISSGSYYLESKKTIIDQIDLKKFIGAKYKIFASADSLRYNNSVYLDSNVFLNLNKENFDDPIKRDVIFYLNFGNQYFNYPENINIQENGSPEISILNSKFNEHLYLNGSSHLDCKLNLEEYVDLSIQSWVRLLTDTPGDGNAGMSLYGNDKGFHAHQLVFRNEGRLGVFDKNSQPLSLPFIWEAFKWQHFLQSYNPFGVKVYRDNVLVYEKIYDMPSDYLLEDGRALAFVYLNVGYNGDFNFTIGRSGPEWHVPRLFNGQIDEFTIFKRSITELELNNLYNLNNGNEIGVSYFENFKNNITSDSFVYTNQVEIKETEKGINKNDSLLRGLVFSLKINDFNVEDTSKYKNKIINRNYNITENKLNKYLLFNNYEYLELKNINAYYIKNNLSIHLKISFSDFSTSQVIVSKKRKGGTHYEILYIKDRDQSLVIVYNNNGQEQLAKISLNRLFITQENVWYNLVVMLHEEGLDFYNDGTLRVQVALNSPNYSIIETNQEDGLFIGGYKQEDVFQKFKGKIELINIWNRKLSSTEISRLMFSQSYIEKNDYIEKNEGQYLNNNLVVHYELNKEKYKNIKENDLNIILYQGGEINYNSLLNPILSNDLDAWQDLKFQKGYLENNTILFYTGSPASLGTYFYIKQEDVFNDTRRIENIENVESVFNYILTAILEHYNTSDLKSLIRKIQEENITINILYNSSSSYQRIVNKFSEYCIDNKLDFKRLFFFSKRYVYWMVAIERGEYLWFSDFYDMIVKDLSGNKINAMLRGKCFYEDKNQGVQFGPKMKNEVQKTLDQKKSELSEIRSLGYIDEFIVGNPYFSLSVFIKFRNKLEENSYFNIASSSSDIYGSHMFYLRIKNIKNEQVNDTFLEFYLETETDDEEAKIQRIPIGYSFYDFSKWHNIIIIYTGYENHIYIDGYKKYTWYQFGSIKRKFISVGYNNNFLGKNNELQFYLGNTDSSYGEANISKFSIWNRVLEENEIYTISSTKVNQSYFKQETKKNQLELFSEKLEDKLLVSINKNSFENWRVNFLSNKISNSLQKQIASSSSSASSMSSSSSSISSQSSKSSLSSSSSSKISSSSSKNSSSSRSSSKSSSSSYSSSISSSNSQSSDSSRGIEILYNVYICFIDEASPIYVGTDGSSAFNSDAFDLVSVSNEEERSYMILVHVTGGNISTLGINYSNFPIDKDANVIENFPRLSPQSGGDILIDRLETLYGEFLPQISSVTVLVDNSGSMTKAEVIGSISILKDFIESLGLQFSDVPVPSDERWISWITSQITS